MKKNKDDGLISVVIPTCNRSVLLRRAVESVINQDYKNIEIIVVSDGSTDDTEDTINDLAKKDKRIKFYSHKVSRGGNYTRNKGIEKSSGEFIAFLDDDDEWLPTKLSKQFAIISRNDNIGLVHTGIHVLYPDYNIDYFILNKPHGRLLISQASEIGTTSSVLLRRKCLEQVHGFDDNLRSRQDMDLWIRIIQISEIAYIDEPLVLYYNYINNNQVSCNITNYLNALDYMKKKYSFFYDGLNTSEKKRIDSSNYYSAALRCFKVGNKQQTRFLLKKSLKCKLSLKSIVIFILSYFIHFKFLLLLYSLKSKLEMLLHNYNK